MNVHDLKQQINLQFITTKVKIIIEYQIIPCLVHTKNMSNISLCKLSILYSIDYFITPLLDFVFWRGFT